MGEGNPHKVNPSHAHPPLKLLQRGKTAAPAAANVPEAVHSLASSILKQHRLPGILKAHQQCFHSFQRVSHTKGVVAPAVHPGVRQQQHDVQEFQGGPRARTRRGDCQDPAGASLAPPRVPLAQLQPADLAGAVPG